jgi:HprK-related kinase B
VIKNAQQAASILRSGHGLVDEVLHIKVGGFCLGIRSNSSSFISRLASYFQHVVVDACKPDVVVEAYDTEVVKLDLDWRDWAREPGKTGRKDAYYELEDGRLLLKVRTGMIFLQSFSATIAAGPCSRLDNQVINFINSQYMNALQQDGWLICHAAGLDVNGRGLGMAGLSGGGKSTLMLSLMDYPDVRYVTNDRLFIRREADRVKAVGIPKLPRINPGTIVHNPALHGLIDEQRRQELLALPKRELWHLEEKHDVMIDDVYGADRIENEMELRAFLVLNWSHDTHSQMQLSEVDLDSRRDLLPAIMKSPGPFFQFSDGSLYQDSMQPEPQAYLDVLRGVTIFEASGRVDLPMLKQELYSRVKSQ